MKSSCTFGTCDKPHYAKGMCLGHYRRRRFGRPMEPKLRCDTTLADRIAAQVTRTGDGCLEWTGRRSTDGYGSITVNYVKMNAHRAAWIAARGPIAGGLVVCHRCDNRACCELSHLFLGTTQDNTADMMAKGRSARGEHNARAKLTAAQVVEIRRRAATGETQVSIAADFGVRSASISYILNGRNWRHVQ